MQVNQLSEKQLEAIIRFAAKYGRTWKSKLRDVWMDGNYHGTMFSGSDACYLQAVRNQFGPEWLVKFSLKAAQAALPKYVPDPSTFEGDGDCDREERWVS